MNSRSASGAKTLPQVYYTSEAILRREIEQIFSQRWLFHPDAVALEDFDPTPAVDFWDMTNRQDWHLCTISQQGISSRAYTPGPYANLESQLAAFDSEYLRALGPGPPHGLTSEPTEPRIG